MSRNVRIEPFIPRASETDLAPRARHAEQRWHTMRQLGERLGFSEETIRKKNFRRSYSGAEIRTVRSDF